MEGPTVYTIKQELQPFVGKKINNVSGYSKAIDNQIFLNQRIKDIFSWGKHLVFQFDDFALRVHFMLLGTYESEVEGKKFSGDYPKTPYLTLKFDFDNGHMDMYSSALKLHPDTKDLKSTYDFTVDVMSEQYDEEAAFKLMQKKPEAEISDILLDQKIFSGVGNKIRNEVLFMNKILPTRKIKDIDLKTLRQLVKDNHALSWQFYEWRKVGELNNGQHWKIYRKKVCSVCGGKITHAYTGKTKRSSYFCTTCQK